MRHRWLAGWRVNLRLRRDRKRKLVFFLFLLGLRVVTVRYDMGSFIPRIRFMIIMEWTNCDSLFFCVHSYRKAHGRGAYPIMVSEAMDLLAMRIFWNDTCVLWSIARVFENAPKYSRGVGKIIGCLSIDANQAKYRSAKYLSDKISNDGAVGFSLKWRHHRHLESMTSYKNSKPINFFVK